MRILIRNMKKSTQVLLEIVDSLYVQNNSSFLDLIIHSSKEYYEQHFQVSLFLQDARLSWLN